MANNRYTNLLKEQTNLVEQVLVSTVFVENVHKELLKLQNKNLHWSKVKEFMVSADSLTENELKDSAKLTALRNKGIALLGQVAERKALSVEVEALGKKLGLPTSPDDFIAKHAVFRKELQEMKSEYSSALNKTTPIILPNEPYQVTKELAFQVAETYIAKSGNDTANSVLNFNTEFDGTLKKYDDLYSSAHDDVLLLHTEEEQIQKTVDALDSRLSKLSKASNNRYANFASTNSASSSPNSNPSRSTSQNKDPDNATESGCGIGCFKF